VVQNARSGVCEVLVSIDLEKSTVKAVLSDKSLLYKDLGQLAWRNFIVVIKSGMRYTSFVRLGQ
jgi:hypothetical protein